MGHFNGLNDDDAELLIGGAVAKSAEYNGSNYGQFKKSNPEAANPSTAFGGGNYGQSKKK